MLPVHRLIGHKEWAPGRKSDPVYAMSWRRSRVAAFQPLEEDPLAGYTPEQIVSFVHKGASLLRWTSRRAGSARRT